MLEEAKDDRKRMEQEISRAFDFVHSKIDDQKSILDNLIKNMEIIDSLRQENVNLKQRVMDLETRVQEQEQYTRANTVEIQGLPEEKNEDVYALVTKVGAALDLPLTRRDIDVCHRLGKKKDSNQPASIIVKFVRREDKLNLLQKRRTKRNFSTEHLGFQHPSSPIYINESLSPTRRKLFSLARQIQKDKNYNYLWVRNGNIFIRKQQGDPAIKICSLDVIEKL
ncbi:uncharacterized protein LOC116168070 [Photinus pyralis]|uniref:uncharacterized protein LOC116168070 n=1 Tax=Photinus pyralis TaxID=7054 RepID=UPI0012675920|nr:uncharacterized protein LOC116168070 [Photinus pyralis]